MEPRADPEEAQRPQNTHGPSGEPAAWPGVAGLELWQMQRGSPYRGRSPEGMWCLRSIQVWCERPVRKCLDPAVNHTSQKLGSKGRGGAPQAQVSMVGKGAVGTEMSFQGSGHRSGYSHALDLERRAGE